MKILTVDIIDKAMKYKLYIYIYSYLQEYIHIFLQIRISFTVKNMNRKLMEK